MPETERGSDGESDRSDIDDLFSSEDVRRDIMNIQIVSQCENCFQE